ncbi:MAG TPA: sigma factor [Planctomycetota bacterium]|nr:sigma factor [Planctomycetota bacterium]
MDLGALYDAWASRLLAYMMTITRDRSKAEDALHNLFVKLSTGRPDLRDPSVYLFRAARNEALRVARRRTGPREVGQGPRAARDAGPLHGEAADG